MLIVGQVSRPLRLFLPLLDTPCRAVTKSRERVDSIESSHLVRTSSHLQASSLEGLRATYAKFKVVRAPARTATDLKTFLSESLNPFCILEIVQIRMRSDSNPVLDYLMYDIDETQLSDSIRSERFPESIFDTPY